MLNRLLPAICCFLLLSCTEERTFSDENLHDPANYPEGYERLQLMDSIMSEVYEEVRLYLLPEIEQNPALYWDVYDSHDDWGLLTALYEAYEIDDLSGYDRLLEHPSLVLSIGGYGRKNKRSFSKPRLLGMLVPTPEGERFQGEDLESGRALERKSKSASDELRALIHEPHGLTGVDANGNTFYGESYLAISGMDPDTVTPLWNGSGSFRVLPLYSDRLTPVGDTTSVTGGNLPCTRDGKAGDDHIGKIRFADMDAFDRAMEDGWGAFGRPQFRIVILYAVRSSVREASTLSYGATTRMLALKREDLLRSCGFGCKEIDWYEWDLPLGNFLRKGNGEKLVIHFFEMDQNFPREIAYFDYPSTRYQTDTGYVHIPGVTLDRVIGVHDDRLGSVEINYCDEAQYPGTTYSTGDIVFTMYKTQ